MSTSAGRRLAGGKPGDWDGAQCFVALPFFPDKLLDLRSAQSMGVRTGVFLCGERSAQRHGKLRSFKLNMDLCSV